MTACPSCGHENPEGQKFCGECATPLGAPARAIPHDLDRGWLLMADAGEPLRVLGNPPERWLEILTTYTKLQIDKTGHADEHRVVT